MGTVMWNRKEYRLADRLTSCSPEHPYYNCRPLQNMGLLKNHARGVVSCLEVLLSRTDSLQNCRAPAPGCPTTSLWFSAVNPLPWCEIQPVLRPCAPAGLEGLFLGISGSKGWVEDMSGGGTAACTEQGQCSWRPWQPFLPSITPCP